MTPESMPEARKLDQACRDAMVASKAAHAAYLTACANLRAYRARCAHEFVLDVCIYCGEDRS